jgi:hypothetical protein
VYSNRGLRTEQLHFPDARRMQNSVSRPRSRKKQLNPHAITKDLSYKCSCAQNCRYYPDVPLNPPGTRPSSKLIPIKEPTSCPLDPQSPALGMSCRVRLGTAVAIVGAKSCSKDAINFIGSSRLDVVVRGHVRRLTRNVPIPNSEWRCWWQRNTCRPARRVRPDVSIPSSRRGGCLLRILTVYRATASW